jgi:LysR family transcriptional regulator, positive regulator for ilvC
MRPAHFSCDINPLLALIRKGWNMPELDDFRLTVAAAERGNFGAVAREHHVSQSTVSRAVHRTETAIGRTLFNRIGRVVELQGDATRSIESLRELIEQWEQLVASAHTNSVSELTIFCTVTASQLIAPPLLEQFRRLRPDVHLDLRTGPAGSAVDAVRSGEVSTAIAPLPTRLPRGLVGAAIATTPLVAAAPIDVRSFAGQTVILSRQGLIRDLAERWVRRALPSTTLVRDAETNEEVLALAALGSGIAIIPELVLDASPLKKRVRILRPDTALPSVAVGLVARRADIDEQPLADLWRLVSN